ncbi:uncharacterized protein K02A2.6-like [Topomyia yanbarensis]|uniref:uncharacterized protein K02A2.6-like n=1 Tax=Topomyia yanbarensis TaxID=2498891 RepID=UPI00273C3DE6|nr:uncharacterized protein K02A2.6-like [Topomyia yanbarensis]
MERVFVPKAVWETIALDFNGPYVKFGGISILVIVDYRSRYLIARPVKSTTFEFTRKILEDVFEREGYPKTIKSDNGPPFNGDDYKRYCAQRGKTTIFSTPLFPQQNGMVESYMKVINKAMAAASADKTNFFEELREAINAHNSATHSVTKVPPEEVMLGRKVKRGLPLLHHEKASYDEKLFESSDRQSKIAGKTHEDARRGAKTCKVKPNDTVIVQRHTRAKGETRFLPKRHTVLQEKNGNLVLDDGDGHVLKRHVSQTKKGHQWRDHTVRETEKFPTDTKGNKPGEETETTGNPTDATATTGNPTDCIVHESEVVQKDVAVQIQSGRFQLSKSENHLTVKFVVCPLIALGDR